MREAWIDLVMKRNDIGDSYVFGCSSGSLRRSRYFSLALSGVRNAVGDGGAARGSMRIPAHRPPDGAASVANFRDAPPLRTTACLALRPLPVRTRGPLLRH